MSTDRDRLLVAFDSGDLEELVALLDKRVVWRGLLDAEFVEEANLEEGPDERAS